MTISHVKDETGDYTYDTETGKWTKLNNNGSDYDSYRRDPTSREEEKEKEIEIGLSNKMFQNPPGFTTELSPNPNDWRLCRGG